jgi:hypothetical protein
LAEDLFLQDGFFVMAQLQAEQHIQIYLLQLEHFMVKVMDRQRSTFLITEVDSFVVQMIWELVLLDVIRMLGLV